MENSKQEELFVQVEKEKSFLQVLKERRTWLTEMLTATNHMIKFEERGPGNGSGMIVSPPSVSGSPEEKEGGIGSVPLQYFDSVWDVVREKMPKGGKIFGVRTFNRIAREGAPLWKKSTFSTFRTYLHRRGQLDVPKRGNYRMPR